MFCFYTVFVAASIVRALLHFEFNDTIYPTVEIATTATSSEKKWLKLKVLCAGSSRWRMMKKCTHKIRVEMIIKTWINPYIFTTEDFIIPFARPVFIILLRFFFRSHFHSAVSILPVWKVFMQFFFSMNFFCQFLFVNY